MFAADGVIVGIAALVTTIVMLINHYDELDDENENVRELIEQGVRDRSDELTVAIGVSACTKTDVIECHYRWMIHCLCKRYYYSKIEE